MNKQAYNRFFMFDISRENLVLLELFKFLEFFGQFEQH